MLNHVPKKSSLPSILSVCFAVFSSAASMSCVFAILPSVGRSLGLNEIQLSLVVTPAAIIFVLFGPVWGKIGQYWSSKSILVVALIVVATFTLLFAWTIVWRQNGYISLTECFLFLTASRIFLSPFSAAVFPVAQSWIARTIDNSIRPQALAGLGAAFGLGMVAAPGLVAVATGFGLLAPFYIVIFFLLASSYFSKKMLINEFSIPITKKTTEINENNDKKHTTYLLLWKPLTMLVLLYMVYGILMQVTGFKIQDQFNLTPIETAQRTGVTLMITAISLVLTQLFFIKKPFFTLKNNKIIILTTSSLGLMGLISMIFNPPFYIQIISMASFGLSLGVFLPYLLSNLTYIAQEAGDQTRVAGFSGSAQGLGMILGPILGASAYHLSPYIPYSIATLILLLTLIIYMLNNTKNSISN
ncbi:MFS transporter [Salmonella enterica]|nr:MFS transporter [Salmonella enterica]